MKSNIVGGTQYQYDLKDLAMIGKNAKGIVLYYKQGLSVQIDISDKNDIERQYKDVCDAHLEYNSQLFSS